LIYIWVENPSTQLGEQKPSGEKAPKLPDHPDNLSSREEMDWAKCDVVLEISQIFCVTEVEKNRKLIKSVVTYEASRKFTDKNNIVI
jgi:hypothetical protein